MIEPDVEFIPPPEAPVFEPTLEEFSDPLTYIAKIRPIAEKSGICKVKPPPEWQPPFAVDVDNFRFVPRVQKLNELEAKTRVKLQFLDKLAKFWELQGSPLRIPFVERKYLDLFTLQKIVNEEGGFEQVCRDRKWARITTRMGYPPSKGIGSTLRNHYDKVLYPFDVFKIGALIDPKKLKEEMEQEMKNEMKHETNGMKMEPDIGGGGGGGGMRRSKRIVKDEAKLDYTVNKELARLQFFGPGPKAAVAEDDEIIDESEEEMELDAKGNKKKRKKKKVPTATLR